MDRTSKLFHVGANATRWTARILSTFIVIFVGFFLVSAVVGSLTGATDPPHAPPPSQADRFMFIFMATVLVGLALAWKWELTGGIIALVAYAGAVFIHPGMLKDSALFAPITAVLFLVSWWLHRPQTKEHDAECLTQSQS